MVASPAELHVHFRAPREPQGYVFAAVLHRAVVYAQMVSRELQSGDRPAQVRFHPHQVKARRGYPHAAFYRDRVELVLVAPHAERECRPWFFLKTDLSGGSISDAR